MPEVIALGIDGVKDATAVVVLLLNLEACRKLAVEILKRRHKAAPPSDMVTISVTVNGNSQSITIDRTLPAAEDQALEFLLTAFR